MKQWTLVLVLASVLVSAASSRGAEPAASPPAGPITYTPPTWPEPPAAGPLLLRLALATALVLAVGVGGMRAVRHFAPQAPAGKSDSRLRIVEKLALGNGGSLFLLECCGRRFVAGVSPTGLRSLTALPDPFENELDVLSALT